MKLVTDIFVILHLLGMASLMTGFLGQMKELKNGAKVTAAVFHGSWTLLVTGFVLVGLAYAPDSTEEPNSWVLAAKAIVITVIFFIAYTYNKKTQTPKWVIPVIGLLTIVNISLAVLGPIMIDKA
ncbi:MAG: hypothetical protein ACKOWE_01020 [Micrococcales bacterium]